MYTRYGFDAWRSMTSCTEIPVRAPTCSRSGPCSPPYTTGTSIVREASGTWHIPVEIVDADPAAHDEWLGAMTAAVERLLSR